VGAAVAVALDPGGVAGGGFVGVAVSSAVGSESVSAGAVAVTVLGARVSMT
jgi:hypothetical protein